MSPESRDELLIGLLEDDLPAAERARLEEVLRNEPGTAARLEELRAVDRRLFLVGERAWQASGLAGVRLENPARVGGAAIVPTEGAFARMRRWIIGPYAAPIAAGLLVALFGGGAYVSTRGRNEVVSAAPVVVGTIHESEMATLPQGERVWTQRVYEVEAGSVAAIALSDNSNSLIYASGRGTLRFDTDRDVRQDGGSCYYILRPSEKVYHVDLPDGIRISTLGATFEVHGGGIRVQDGSISVGGGAVGAGITMLAGEMILLDGSAKAPSEMTAEQRANLGAWTGQFGGRSRGTGANRTAGAEKKKQVAGDAQGTATFLPPAVLASMIPPDAWGAFSLRLSEDTTARLGVHGPVLVAFTPKTQLPLVLMQSSDPGAASQFLVDALGTILRPAMFDQDQPGTLELVWRETARSARPQTAAFLVQRGPLVMLVGAEATGLPPKEPIASTEDSLNLRSTPIPSFLANDEANVDLSFVVLLGRMLQARGAGREWLGFLGIEPDSMLSGRGIQANGAMRLAAKIPTRTEGAGEMLADTGELGLLAHVPEAAGFFASLTAVGPERLLQTWERILLTEAYAGNAQLMTTQRSDFEGEIGFALKEEFARACDGRVAFAAMWSDAGIEGVLLVGLSDRVRAAAMLRRRLSALEAPRGAPPPIPGDAPESGARWRIEDDTLIFGSSLAALESTESPLMSAEEIAALGREGPTPPLLLCVSPLKLAEWSGRAIEPAQGESEPMMIWVHPARTGGGWQLSASVPSSNGDVEALLDGMGLPVKRSIEVRSSIRALGRQLDALNTAVASFARARNRPPQDLRELSDAGFLPYPISDPFNPNGGPPAYEVDIDQGYWSLWSYGPDRRNDLGRVRWEDSMSLADPGDIVVRGSMR